MMKTPFALLLLTALFCVCCATEPISEASAGLRVKQVVDNIDSHLKTLNRSNTLLQTGTDRGGELAIYRSGSNIIRIDATISLSNSDLRDVFYYDNAKLIFVRSKKITYPYSAAVNGFDFSLPRLESSADFYVREGRLIPVGEAGVAPVVASRLSQEGRYVFRAVRQGNQPIDIQKLLK